MEAYALKSKAKHTPGPWTKCMNINYIKRKKIVQHVITPMNDNGTGFRGKRYLRVSGIIDEHDASLIESAPELLAACENALRHMREMNGDPDVRMVLAEAIAKAKGI